MNFVDEYVVGLVKGSVFGFLIVLVSCYYGLMVRGGAMGVGRVVNDVVVVSVIGIFVIDFVVGAIWVWMVQ